MTSVYLSSFALVAAFMCCMTTGLYITCEPGLEETCFDEEQNCYNCTKGTFIPYKQQTPYLIVLTTEQIGLTETLPSIVSDANSDSVTTESYVNSSVDDDSANSSSGVSVSGSGSVQAFSSSSSSHSEHGSTSEASAGGGPSVVDVPLPFQRPRTSNSKASTASEPSSSSTVSPGAPFTGSRQPRTSPPDLWEALKRGRDERKQRREEEKERQKEAGRQGRETRGQLHTHVDLGDDGGARASFEVSDDVVSGDVATSFTTNATGSSGEATAKVSTTNSTRAQTNSASVNVQSGTGFINFSPKATTSATDQEPADEFPGVVRISDFDGFFPDGTLALSRQQTQSTSPPVEALFIAHDCATVVRVPEAREDMPQTGRQTQSYPSVNLCNAIFDFDNPTASVSCQRYSEDSKPRDTGIFCVPVSRIKRGKAKASAKGKRTAVTSSASSVTKTKSYAAICKE